MAHLAQPYNPTSADKRPNGDVWQNTVTGDVFIQADSPVGTDWFLISSVSTGSTSVIADLVVQDETNILEGKKGKLIFSGAGVTTYNGSATTEAVVYIPITDTYWTSGSTGNFSIRANNNTTIATANYAVSEGSGTTASGVASHAEGVRTTAIGVASHAEGQYSTASGNRAHSEGLQTTASGDQSHAEGELSVATNTWAHAEGRQTNATGQGSHSEGKFTWAIGNNSHAEGERGRAIGTDSHAEGDSTTATGYASHSEGTGTQALEDVSHAEGSNTWATGYASHAEGFQSTASGEASHAEGGFYDIVYSVFNAGGSALGKGSHAEGVLTTAAGDGSHAEGSGTTANGLVAFLTPITVFENISMTSSDPFNGQYAVVFNGVDVVSVWQGYYSFCSPFLLMGGSGSDFQIDCNNLVDIYYDGSNTYLVDSTLTTLADDTFTIINGDTFSQTYSKIGDYGHAEGQGSNAFGNASHAEGYYTTALGHNSHAGGTGSTASGLTSFIHSTNSLVTGNRSVVLGGSALTGATDDTVYVPFFNIKNVNEHADNAAALLAGEAIGNVYRTGDFLKIVH